jgi:hypothetical protein
VPSRSICARNALGEAKKVWLGIPRMLNGKEPPAPPAARSDLVRHQLDGMPIRQGTQPTQIIYVVRTIRAAHCIIGSTIIAAMRSDFVLNRAAPYA